MHKTKFKTFTLIELIIVIAIIAILAVTAFLVLTKWLGKSRDSRRLNDLSTIDNALQVSITEKGYLPKPDNSILIYASGTSNIVGYQGLFTNNTKASISNINSTPIDPTDNTNYIYYVDSTAKYYQILGFTENTTSYATNTANAVDYSKRYIQTRGDKLGILLSGDNTPINLISGMTGVDIQNTTGNYNAYFDNTNKLSGTGIILQWLQSNIGNGGAGFSSPTNCPIGFIPVPGNPDFNQPGFCVAKYEMKQINGTQGSVQLEGTVWTRNASSTEICGTDPSTICQASVTNTSGATNRLDRQIISKADGMPIVNLNQATAIQACQAMGQGYHLITNKEYMTIARNIEQQGINWTGGFVGSGGIYRGKNITNNPAFTGNRDPSNLDCASGMTYTGADDPKGVLVDGNNTACQLPSGRNKRALYLSNGQLIWDLVGNAHELVNGADNISGTGFDTIKGNVCGSSTDGWFSYTYNATTDANTQCNFVGSNGYSYGSVGPSISGLNASNGIGRLYSSNSVSAYTDRVMLRGGRGNTADSAGIYAIAITRSSMDHQYSVGFRCAK